MLVSLAPTSTSRQPEGRAHWLQDGAPSAAHAQAARRLERKKLEELALVTGSRLLNIMKIIQSSILFLQPLHLKSVSLYTTIATLHDHSPMYEIPESTRQDVRTARQGLGTYDCPRLPPILLLHFSACVHAIRRGFGVAACLALPHWHIDTTVFPLSALMSVV